MSPPRADWRVHGKANVFSQQAQAPVVPGAALREWLTLADAIHAAGGHIVVLPSDDASLTGMPYTAEAGLLGEQPALDAGGGVVDSGPVFLLPNVRPAHRRGEAPLIARLMTSWGIKSLAVPVPWEGQGDVIDVSGSPVQRGRRGRFVCTSGEGPHARSSPEAYAHVAPFLAGESLHLRFRADPWFHGNTFLAFFRGARENVVVVCEQALLDGELLRLRSFVPDARFVAISVDDSLRYGTNALQIGARVLAPAGAPPALLALWSQLGLEVVPLELPALFGRGGGAAVCLSNRLAAAIEDVPVGSHYQSVRAALLASCQAST